MMDEEFFEKLKEKILPYFNLDDGHGFDHVERVYNLALNIAKEENADLDVVQASALLHDIARHKEELGVPVHERKGRTICHAEEGAKMAKEILEEMNFPEEKINNVVHSIEVHRYSKGLIAKTKEAEILQDADRLDAVGAILFARIADYNIKRKVLFYDKNIPPKEKYDGCSLTNFNFIQERILKQSPENFNTKKARELAKGRYKFVQDFVERYLKEVKGEL